MEWSELLEELENDLDWCDPLYEGTAAGETLEGLMFEVEKELDLYLEPSIQGGHGGIWINQGYEHADGECLAEGIDYEGFNSDCCDIAFESNSPEEFQDGYRRFLQSLI